MRTMLRLAKTDARAGLLAAFYVEGDLSFSLPAVLAGLAVPMIGFAVTAYVYATAVIVMALASMVAVRSPRFDEAIELSAFTSRNRKVAAFKAASYCGTRAGAIRKPACGATVFLPDRMSCWPDSVDAPDPNLPPTAHRSSPTTSLS